MSAQYIRDEPEDQALIERWLHEQALSPAHHARLRDLLAASPELYAERQLITALRDTPDATLQELAHSELEAALFHAITLGPDTVDHGDDVAPPMSIPALDALQNALGAAHDAHLRRLEEAREPPREAHHARVFAFPSWVQHEEVVLQAAAAGDASWLSNLDEDEAAESRAMLPDARYGDFAICWTPQFSGLGEARVTLEWRASAPWETGWLLEVQLSDGRQVEVYLPAERAGEVTLDRALLGCDPLGAPFSYRITIYQS